MEMNIQKRVQRKNKLLVITVIDSYIKEHILIRQESDLYEDDK